MEGGERMLILAIAGFIPVIKQSVDIKYKMLVKTRKKRLT
jgi:hypothetical protein